MPEYASYRVKVTTLTPLHIGSGRDLLHEYDYAVFNGQTWRINEAALLDAQPLDDPKMADQLARTPPARLLRPADFKPDSPYFRYVIKGAPRAQGEGAQAREQIKNLYDRPYLPGSTLKGALRTALGWQLWADRGVRPEARRLGRTRQWAAQDYEHELFGANPNRDLLRALQVGDSAAVGADRLMLANARVVGRGGHLGSPIEIEAIRPDTSLELTVKIDLALFSDWARQAGLQLSGGERLTHLPEVARTYTLARLPQEEAWYGAIPGAQRVASFYTQLRNARLGKGMFLLQIGWGAGWHSKTFGMHLQNDAVFMERIIGDYRLARGSRKAGDPFPKSRRVAVAFNRDASGRTSETPASPFGWVLVEMEQQMKLLTFLGVGKYDTTTYAWQGQEHVSSYAPAASCRFLQPDELVVFLTEGAQQEVYAAFRAALPADLVVQPVPIVLGQNEQELWQIFGQVSSAVEPGEEVAFDITHGLRSFPLLGLLAAAFLRSGLRVSLRAVLYGAFDVRDKSVTPNRTPMFDLTPMLSLLEWAVAADRFNRTGDARRLAAFLKDQQKTLALQAKGDRELLAQAGGLGALATKLTDVSQALRLIRPQQVMAEVAELPQRLGYANPALEHSATTRPFSLLLENIAASYSPLALADAAEPHNSWANIAKQRDMINWYLEREQWTQAVTLAREWVVNWVMVQLGQTNLTQRSARERVEHVIGAETEDFVRAKQEGRRFVSMFFAPLPAVDEVLAVWSALTEVRNDINHAGMRENLKTPDVLIKQITWCVERLNTLPVTRPEAA